MGRRYDQEVEEGLEEAYQSYLERNRKRAAAVEAKRARLAVPGEDDDVAAPDAAAAERPLPELSDEEVRLPFICTRSPLFHPLTGQT